MKQNVFKKIDGKGAHENTVLKETKFQYQITVIVKF